MTQDTRGDTFIEFRQGLDQRSGTVTNSDLPGLSRGDEITTRFLGVDSGRYEITAQGEAFLAEYAGEVGDGSVRYRVVFDETMGES